ncbi:hypothetical protein G9A89_003758 [Geosiphon pyriformis]|nr:hypothetical protein G9A89_003758 [Geosiphon pyriformis]
MMEVNNRFAALERSLTSLAELDAFRPIVLQSSPRCQPLVISSSQNQGADVVMSKGSSVSTSSETVTGAVSKLKDSMKCLMEMVLGLSAKVDSISAHSVSLPLT